MKGRKEVRKTTMNDYVEMPGMGCCRREKQDENGRT